MNNTVNNDDDFHHDSSSWTPPTEAERKVIEARRERSNQISSLMGQYLLKGYRMLATSCAHCDCILLEDRQKNKYCIACSEVDADTKKDNPAVSEHAARRTVEESQHRQTKVETMEMGHPLVETASKLVHSSETAAIVPKENCAERYQRQVSSDSLKHEYETSYSASAVSISRSDFPSEISEALAVLKQKLSWAARQLQGATNVQECQHLVKLISETITAISSIQQFKSSW